MNGTEHEGDREAIVALQVEVRHLTGAVEKLNDQVAILSNQANRWRGAFGVVLLIGALLGWLADHIASLLTPK